MAASTRPLAQKLQIKPGQTLRLIDPPPGYADLLGALPPGATRSDDPAVPADVIQLFVTSRAAMEAVLPTLAAALAPDTTLWVSYPKGSSKRLSADINRDSINAYAQTLGLIGVAIIAIDEEWSALRLKVA